MSKVPPDSKCWMNVAERVGRGHREHEQADRAEQPADAGDRPTRLTRGHAETDPTSEPMIVLARCSENFTS